jgi:hypothetical protein
VHVRHADTAYNIFRSDHTDDTSAIAKRVHAVAIQDEALAKTGCRDSGKMAIPARGSEEIALSRGGSIFRVNPVKPDSNRTCVIDPDVG